MIEASRFYSLLEEVGPLLAPLQAPTQRDFPSFARVSFPRTVLLLVDESFPFGTRVSNALPGKDFDEVSQRVSFCSSSAQNGLMKTLPVVISHPWQV